METLTNYNDHVPKTGSRMLITQFPDDESYSGVTHSDAHSEGGATLYSHVIDSPIPEENEDDVSGRFSRKTNQSNRSKDKRADNENTMGRQSGLSSVDFNDKVSETYERGGRGGGGEGGVSEEEYEVDSYPDSMSMDNLSETLSVTFEAPELRDEDFDTDLEVDDDKWLHPEKYDHDTTGLTKYLNACEEHDVTPVRYFMKHMMETNMNLGHHGLGPAAMRAMAVPLESNTTIEHLDLEGNWIGEEGVQPLCKLLRDNVYIVELNLAENKLGTEGALHVIDLMLENRNIENLNLTGNRITDNAGEPLGVMLKRNTTLRHLKLRHNELGERAAQCIKDALTDNESLETLDISWNHFMTRGCVRLAEAVKENVALKEVNVMMNGFGLEGAIALGEAIKVNRTLLRLDASYCRLPMEGAASIAHGLQHNETLQALNVGYNSLGPDGSLGLLLGLERNDCSNLTTLDLGNSKVTPQFKERQDKLEAERPLRVHHGGVLPDTKAREICMDPVEVFKRDPMTKLKEWVEQAGYRLIDLLRHFDKDQSMSISREEFVNGIKSARIEITDDQIDILLDRLDTDGDGEIDFSELIQGDNDHRSLKRELTQYQEDQRIREEETETALDAFLKNPSD
ncbi:leucine-rich repeat-containing protein 74A-like isoform X2 [Littorina saxatilis]|uniref:EF-hand domain-containing protein n=1 Tax=Littorina saxatilis TaxID=31220 RepID=A0AAN9BIQ9_9CAEN